MKNSHYPEFLLQPYQTTTSLAAYDNADLLSHGSEDIWVGLAGSSALGLMRLNWRRQLGEALIWRLWGRIYFQVHSGCWQNSAPPGCRAEFPIFLLAVSWKSLLAASGCLHHIVPSIFKLAMAWQILLSFESLQLPLWAYLFYLSWRKCSTFKGSCVLIGST